VEAQIDSWWLAIILISKAAMITSMMATDSTPKDRASG
jgi:hypothetical protein